jgi:hypothetical protein
MRKVSDMPTANSIPDLFTALSDEQLKQGVREYIAEQRGPALTGLARQVHDILHPGGVDSFMHTHKDLTIMGDIWKVTEGALLEEAARRWLQG